MKADSQLNHLRHMGHLLDNNNNTMHLKHKVNNHNNSILNNNLSREINSSSNNNIRISSSNSTNNNSLCRDLLSRNKPNNCKDHLLKTIPKQINLKGLLIIFNLLSKDSNIRVAKNKILLQTLKILKTPVKMTMIHLPLFWRILLTITIIIIIPTQMLLLLLHLNNSHIPINLPLVLAGRNLKTILIIRKSIHGVTTQRLVSWQYSKVINHNSSLHSSSLLIPLHNLLLQQAHPTKAVQIKQILSIAFSVLLHSQNQSNNNRNSIRKQQHLISIVFSQMMMFQTSQLQVFNRNLIFLLWWINKKIICKQLISIPKTQQLQGQLKLVHLTQKAWI